MTGIDSYSTTPANNATCDAGSINWAEGQAPSTVNNTARQLLADIRAQKNDDPWFQYGTGDQNTSTHLAVPAVYASSTSFTIAGADVTAAYHRGRRVRAVGVSTGTIYGTIITTAYAPTTTTVTVTWDSGSLSNETLTVSISTPNTGSPTRPPIAFAAYLNTSTQSISSGTPTKVTLDAEEYDVGGYFDSATNYRFLPKVAGYYQISGRVNYAPSGASNSSAFLDIYKNGSRYKRGGSTEASNTLSAIFPSVSALVFLNGSTDYVELYTTQSSGGSVNINNGGDSALNYMTGVLVIPT